MMPLFGRNLMGECKCDEARLVGFSVRSNPRPKLGWEGAHDCRYIAERNALIPEAERIALLAVAYLPDDETRQKAWPRAFLEAMDDLVRKRRAC